MRRAVLTLLLASLFMLAACEALRPQARIPYVSLPPQGSEDRGLPRQDLPPGACAVFLFTREVRPVFVLYDHLDAGLVRAWLNGEIRHVTVDPRRDPPGQAAHYHRRIMIDGEAVIFSGEMVSADGGGAEIPAATMRRVLSDGAQAVVPLSGIYWCQPRGN